MLLLPLRWCLLFMVAWALLAPHPPPAVTAATTTTTTTTTITVSETIPISQQEVASVVSNLNKFRRRMALRTTATDMSEVRWNYALEKDLRAFASRRGAKWFFEQNTRFPFPHRPNMKPTQGPFNGFFLMHLPEFATWRQRGFSYLLHDTCIPQRCVERVLAFRQRQSFCFSRPKCGAATFSNFHSCDSRYIPRVSAQPCSWSWLYVPWLLRADLTSFACVHLNVPGPRTPKHQPDSFWCYSTATVPSNDVPFRVGARLCSACPPSRRRCDAGLCSP